MVIWWNFFYRVSGEEVINVSMPHPHIKNPFITLRWFSAKEKTPMINDYLNQSRVYYKWNHKLEQGQSNMFGQGCEHTVKFDFGQPLVPSTSTTSALFHPTDFTEEYSHEYPVLILHSLRGFMEHWTHSQTAFF